MNSIKTFLNGLGRGTRVFLLALAVIFVGAGITQASTSTTIGTDILTTGTLGVTGLSSLGHASSTMLTAHSAYFGGIGSGATSTFATNGALTLGGALSGTTASFSGLASFLAGATTTTLTLLSGDTLTNAAASTTVLSGTLSLATTTTVGLIATGNTTLASTTATTFKVGNLGTQLSKVWAGFCVTESKAIPATYASSTQTYMTCTPTNSLLLTGANVVLVQATSSLPSWVVIQSASTTAGGLISVGLTNFSTTTGVAAAAYALNFWAFQ